MGKQLVTVARFAARAHGGTVCLNALRAVFGDDANVALFLCSVITLGNSKKGLGQLELVLIGII